MKKGKTDKQTEKPLTIREQKVVRNLISGMTKKDALLSAGYAESTATKKAEEIVGKSRIKKAIQKILEEQGMTDEKLAEDLVNDYKVNGKKSLDRMGYSLLHLKGYFSGFKAMNITTDIIQKYIVKRQAEGAENATINKGIIGIAQNV